MKFFGPNSRTVFKAVWKDTAKTQNMYDQLMKLTMQNYDINTYNATFEQLTATAEWEPNVKGTITHYWSGLRSNIHHKILECECYVTVGTFTRCGLGSAKQQHWVVLFWVLSTKSEEDLDSFWWRVVDLWRNKSFNEE